MISIIYKCRYYLDLSKFFWARRFHGFSVPDQPHFDEQSNALFASLIRNARFYLEYGSGGSTVVAAKLNKPFVSVDTDPFFLKSVRRKIGARNSNRRLVHADVGLTGPWGMPLRTKHVSHRRLKKWRAYANTPWRFVNGNLPDLVLVDGRFRVASALTSFAKLVANPNAKILVDDYADRPHYHILEKHGKLTKMVGRMAIFQPPQQVNQNIQEEIDRYSADWR